MYSNVATFLLVLIILTITVVCLIQYKQRQDAERAPDLKFKLNESIYKQSTVHLNSKQQTLVDDNSDSDDELK